MSEVITLKKVFRWSQYIQWIFWLKKYSVTSYSSPHFKVTLTLNALVSPVAWKFHLKNFPVFKTGVFTDFDRVLFEFLLCNLVVACTVKIRNGADKYFLNVTSYSFNDENSYRLNFELLWCKICVCLTTSIQHKSIIKVKDTYLLLYH